MYKDQFGLHSTSCIAVRTMCRGKLGVIPCTCNNAKGTKMGRKVIKYSSNPVPVTVDAANQSAPQSSSSVKKLSKNSHFGAIRRYVKLHKEKRTKSNKGSALPSEGSVPGTDKTQKEDTYTSCTFYHQTHICNSQPLVSSCSNTQIDITTEVPTVERMHSSSKRNLRTIIPTPVIDEQLQKEGEFRMCSEEMEEGIVTERLEDDYYEPDSLSPLPVFSDSDSVINLDSILLEEDACNDVGPEPSLFIDEDLDLDRSTKRVTFRNHSPHRPRCHSMSEVHRRIHVFDQLLYSVDLEYGASDFGPEPEFCFDDLTVAGPMAKAEVTQQQVTTADVKRPVHRGSDNEAIIDSLFAPKKKHSCCKSKRKSSLNGVKSQRNASQINIVPRHRPRKVVVIGDMCAGKSALIAAYCKDRFNETYVPTILRSCLTDANVYGERVELVVIEISGREDYFKLRKCAYRKTDAIILCYSCDNSSSLHNIKTKWLPEIRENVPNVPFVLVGTRKDAREEILDQIEATRLGEKVQESDSDYLRAVKEKLVSEGAGHEMAEATGAQYFLECSARYRDGTRRVFETVAKVALQKSRRKRKVQRTGDVCSVM